MSRFEPQTGATATRGSAGTLGGVAGNSRRLAWALGATVVLLTACGGSSPDDADGTIGSESLLPATEAESARSIDADETWDPDDGHGTVTLRPVLTCEPGAEADEATGQAILPLVNDDESCVVGPPAGTGEVFERGSAVAGLTEQTEQWVIDVELRAAGVVVWNAVAQECFNATPACPSRQVAIVLDDVIQSAPTVETLEASRTVRISGDFSEDEARALARALNRRVTPAEVGDDSGNDDSAESANATGVDETRPVDTAQVPASTAAPTTTGSAPAGSPTGFAMPEMCGLPAVEWTSNEHPLSVDNGPWASASRVDGDLTGDDVDEIVWATVCGAGTVAAGRAVHVFDSSHRPLATLPVQEFVAEVYPDRTVHPIEPRIVEGDVQVEVWVWQSVDATCCPSVAFEMSFAWDGDRFVPTSDIPDPAEVGAPSGEAPIVAWDGEYRAKTSPGRVVQLGHFGQQVESLQQALDQRGYDVDVDGFFGRGTESAVRQFQRDRGLPVTGIATDDVWNEFGE